LNQLSRLAKDKLQLRRPSIKKLNANKNDIEEDESISIRGSEQSRINIDIKRSKVLDTYLTAI